MVVGWIKSFVLWDLDFLQVVGKMRIGIRLLLDLRIKVNVGRTYWWRTRRRNRKGCRQQVTHHLTNCQPPLPLKMEMGKKDDRLSCCRKRGDYRILEIVLWVCRLSWYLVRLRLGFVSLERRTLLLLWETSCYPVYQGDCRFMYSSGNAIVVASPIFGTWSHDIFTCDT
jgi:hypothetical protein